MPLSSLSMSFLPCLGGFVPGNGAQMAPTEKPFIPHGVVVRTQTRDLAIRKPDNDERVLEQPSFTVLPGFLIVPKLPIVRLAPQRFDLGRCGARRENARLVQYLRGAGGQAE